MSNLLYKKLQELAKEDPEQIFVSDSVTKFSRIHFLEQVKKKSARLKEAGFKRNAVTGLLADNCIESVITIFSLWKMNITPAVFNTMWTEGEINAAARKYGIKKLIKFNDPSGLSVSFVDIHPGKASNYRNKRLSGVKYNSEDAAAVILFTSGSTGYPKAVEISVSNLFNNFKAVSEFIDLRENDTWLASLPFYHIGGFAIIARSLFAGSPLLLTFTFETGRILEAIGRLKPNLMSFVPAKLKSILSKSPNALKESKALFVGGGPVDAGLIERCLNLRLPIVKVYGSTETTSMIAAADAYELSDNFETAGKALAGTGIKIVDSNWNELNRGETGLIAVKGNTIAKGYLRNAEEWQKRFKEGYFLTGDYGKIDGFGFLYIEMRREDLIVTGGENVNPREVEAVLKSIPGISDAYIFSLPDDKWGEAVCALMESEKSLDKVYLKKELKEKLAGYKIPKRIAFITKLPRTELGKTDKTKAAEYLELKGTAL